MVNEHSTDFIVVSLLLLWINLAPGVVEFVDQRERTLINVVGDFLFEEGLVKIELFHGKYRITGWVFPENPANNKIWLGAFLDVGEYLVHLVGNDVPILVFANSGLQFPPLFERLIFLFNDLFEFLNFYFFWYLIRAFFDFFIRRWVFSDQSLLLARLRVRIGNLVGLRCSASLFRL